MSENSKGRAALDRPATQHERDIIRWLLEHGDAAYRGLVSQIDSLRVVSRCTCGCPTVDFVLGEDTATRQGAHMICDCIATVDGMDVGVMLFETRSTLSCLEVYSFAGSDDPFGLPAIESLLPWEELSKRVPNALTQQTMRKSANGTEIHQADNAEDLFKKLDI